jgi:glutathione S-transferase
MKLYMHPVSTASRPVMMLVAEAKIDLEQVVVDLMTGEHHQAPFSAINPSRQVPVLQDGDFILTESSAILKYLADKAGSPLYPKDPKQRARVNERMDWFNTGFYREYGYNLVYPQLFAHHKRPTEEITSAVVQWGKEKAAHWLGVLDKHILGSSPYVCGEQMTIADIFGAQILSAGELVKVNFAAYPNVQRWLGRMKQLPSWSAINAAHDGFAASLRDKPMVAP